MRSLFWRRLCSSRVVRLLERAEEGCEGLKHGCYDLPCVYFLIFLCHDIKNKIDMLVFIFMNKIKQNYQNFFGTRSALLERPLAYLERAKRNWNGLRPIGTPARLSCGPCIVCWQDGINPYIISVLLSSGTPSGLLARRSAPSGTELKILFFAFSS